jgi:hypothetical protein
MKKYKNFTEAKAFVNSIGLKKEKPDWRQWCKSVDKPDDIPTSPDTVYKNEWQGWADWLGNGGHRRNSSLPFLQAREYVIKLNLKSQKEWFQFVHSGQKPNNIPATPNEVYVKNWISWGDWLGTNVLSNIEKGKLMLSFSDARDIVRNAKLKNVKEWRNWNRPDNIPASPERIYKSEWISWGDWFGTNSIATKDIIFLPFEDARNYVISLGLKSQKEWIDFGSAGKRPSNIPGNPSKTYKNHGWISYGHWLGTNSVATFNIAYRPFDEARAFIRSLQLRDQKAWLKYCKSGDKPKDIPSCPNKTYKEHWINLRDWIGTERPKSIRTNVVVKPLNTIEDCKRLFGEFGYTLRQNFYKRGKDRILCTCPKGHDVAVTYNALMRLKSKPGKNLGNCCPECFKLNRKDFKRVVTWDKLIYDLKTIVLPKHNGELPSYKNLVKANYGIGYSVHVAIQTMGGYDKIRRELGLQLFKRTNGYWKDWNNIEKEIKDTFDLSSGVFPSYNQFVKAKISIDSICSYHGINLPQLADKFGCKLASVYKCRDGHFVESIYEATFDEYLYSRNIPHEIHSPVGKYYTDFLINCELHVEIWGYRKQDKNNKIAVFYNKKRKRKERFYKTKKIPLMSIEGPELFNDPLLQIPLIESKLDKLLTSYGYDVAKKQPFDATIVADTGFVWSETIIQKEIQKIIDKLGHFPSGTKIAKYGNSALKSAVHRFGGITYFCKSMGYPTDWINHQGKGTGKKWTDDEIKNRLQVIVTKLGYCPKFKELSKIDAKLYGAINRFGGFYKYKIMLGFKANKPKNYWNEKTIMEEILKYPIFPSQWSLKKSKEYSLLGAICNYGGYAYFRKLYDAFKST